MNGQNKIELRQSQLTELWSGFEELDFENLRQLLRPEIIHGDKGKGLGLQSIRFRQEIESHLLKPQHPWNFTDWQTGDLMAGLIDVRMIQKCSATDQVEQFAEALLDIVLPLLAARVFVLIGLNEQNLHNWN